MGTQDDPTRSHSGSTRGHSSTRASSNDLCPTCANDLRPTCANDLCPSCANGLYPTSANDLCPSCANGLCSACANDLCPTCANELRRNGDRCHGGLHGISLLGTMQLSPTGTTLRSAAYASNVKASPGCLRGPLHPVAFDSY